VPTEVYSISYVYTINGDEIEISPLKIWYLKEFMAKFQTIEKGMDNDESLTILSDCARIAMKQYAPIFSRSVDKVEDNFDIGTIYKVLEIAGGIKFDTTEEDAVISEQAENNDSQSGWETLDLAKLETEIFFIGIWKNYEELEKSITIQELMYILNTKRELDYNEKKFLAALQGVNLDEGQGQEQKGQKEWEDLKARVYSRGAATDSKDILALQGVNAQQAGFGIGMGLSYEVVKD